MKSVKRITFAVAAATFLVAGTASAARPASVANTVWTLQTNQEATTLVITGMVKDSGKKFSDRDYAKVRALEAQYSKTYPRSIAS